MGWSAGTQSNGIDLAAPSPLAQPYSPEDPAMIRPPYTGNRRVLVIDDSPSIHQDFRKILGADQDHEAMLASTEAALFGAAPLARRAFELDSAYQGQQALAMVSSALAQERPYAMAFIDMRMPPGWDGIETVERLWQVDPQLQVALCTAYSDYSWEEMAERLDLSDRLLILKKPFDAIEIRQLASALTVKWQMTQDAALKMSALEQAVEERTKQLSDANIIVRNSPTILYRLRGEPSFPLMYISHNITKFGHDAAQLVASPNWVQELVHPDDQEVLDTAMARVLEKSAQGASIEFRLLTGAGAYRWVENRYIPVRNKEGRLIEIEGIILDITERKLAEEKIALLARTDGLTGLANRATFIERLGQAFAAAERGAPSFAIFYLDLDHFKEVNDTLGHPVGDLLLQHVSARIGNCTRESDVVARLGGDEFAILQLNMGEPANAGALAEKIQSSLALAYSLNGNEVRISASIGICPYAPGSTGPDAMLTQADLALYRSKEEGRNQYHFHSEDLDQQVLDRVTLANDLKLAIDQDELELYYQPQVELSSGKILGMEALVRWNHPVRGLLAADVFIRIAEKTGTIVALGQWVLKQACRQMRRWRDAGVAPPLIAINLSLAQIKSGQELVRDVAKAITTWGLAPSDLEFDVTEATLAQTKWTRNDVLPQLRELGVKIAIDDFGTEYSSFDYLTTYRVNRLKIAQSFIDSASEDPASATTIRAIINFAHELGIGIIAEGVETREQRAQLIATGSTMQAQGFYFSEAVDSTRAGELLRRGRIALHAPSDDHATSLESPQGLA
jgi:diguanylate cyclase (GGDEF)-like protein/PAS domain S-box-containing protein